MIWPKSQGVVLWQLHLCEHKDEFRVGPQLGC